MQQQVSQPFKSVHDQVIAVWKSHSGFKKLDPYKAMAIIVKESMGLPFWCACDALAKANLQNMEEVTGVSRADFIKFNTVKAGIHKGSFPKFRFEISWWSQIHKSTHYLEYSQVEQASLASSWGLGQKSAFYLFGKLPHKASIAQLVNFQGSPELQIDQVFIDLDALDSENEKDFALVATRYNAGATARKVSTYGTDAKHLLEVFTNSYKEEIS